MRKLLILSVFAAIAFVGCKKQQTSVSTVYTYSPPTISLTYGQYYSIPVNGTLPHIAATAYDSFYRKYDSVVIDQSILDNTTPGLYVLTATAKNTYGMTSTKSVYVAVTNISDSLNLTGWFRRTAPLPTTANEYTYVTKLARGMFRTTNVGGVDTSVAATSVIPAIFVVTTPSAIDFGSQPTSVGTLTAFSESLTLVALDTTLNYGVYLTGFPTTVTNFRKL